MDGLALNSIQESRPREILRSGHLACPGCGIAMGMRMVLRAIGSRVIVVVVPSCVAVTSGPYPTRPWESLHFIPRLKLQPPPLRGYQAH